MTISAVTGGTVITPGGPARADLLIDGGTIAAIGDEGGTIAANEDHGGPGGQRLDASGCYVLPGGVDPHCHLMPGVHAATSAAARGGTTTVLSFTGPAAGDASTARPVTTPMTAPATPRLNPRPLCR